jgi:hypothetical protein
MNEPADPKRDFLRHSLATLAYRGGKAVRDVPASFAAFRIASGSRTPADILAHIGDLLDWALRIVKGEARWIDSAPLPWLEEVARFYSSLSSLDALLASDAPLGSTPERVFQGPVADALTHVGQIAMLHRLAGCPMRGENYFVADITADRIGAEQAAPRREFD